MAKVVTFKPGLWEALYIPELLRGMSVTIRHFFLNTFGSREIVTIRYPEEKRVYPRYFRGVHRLMQREDGTPRCVACMMCSTICPAYCIHIESGVRPEGGIEKMPVKFSLLDESRIASVTLKNEAVQPQARRSSDTTPTACSNSKQTRGLATR